MRYISRSSHATFSKCPRKGYWNYLYQGRGLDLRKGDWNLIIGLGVHKGLEGILRLKGIDDAVGDALAEFDRFSAPHREDSDLTAAYTLEENRALVEALVRGWYKARWEAFREQFEVLAIEEEMDVLLAPDLTFQGRADAVIRDRNTGEIYCLNWKTTSTKSYWTAEWQNEVQTWTECMIIEDKLGVEIQGCIYEGLYKGVRAAGSLTLSSPLIYGYRNPKDGAIQAGYKAGWQKFAVWKSGISIADWINSLPEETFDEIFLRSAPIIKDNDVVRLWLRQIVAKEEAAGHVLREGSEEERELFFWQNFSKFNCRGCPFRPACFRLVNGLESLVEAGILSPRQDHHAAKRSEGGQEGAGLA